MRIHRDLLTAVLKVGVPAGLQSMVITLSNLFVQYKISGLGVDAVAAFSVYFKVELLICLPIVAFGQAITWFNRDSDVIACGLRVIRVTFPFYWLYVVLEVPADALRGSGKSVQPMCIILLNLCMIRIILLAVFSRIWGNLEAVAAVYPAAWFGFCLLCSVLDQES